MSEPSHRRERRRADAERSIAAVLDSAISVLSDRPSVSMEDVARAAGVTRQTVYAHFPSRQALLDAVVNRALAETMAAIDAAEIEQGAAAEALDRLVGAGWQTLERYPLLTSVRVALSPEEEHDLHGPILERLERLIRRGQSAGVFDRRLPPNWLLAAFLGLSHAAAEEVAAGRMTAEDAALSLRRSVPRVFGASPIPLD